MIDPNLLVEDFDETARRIARKGVDVAEVARARDLLLDRRQRQTALDLKRAEMNAASKKIGELYRQSKAAEAETLKAAVAQLKTEIGELEAEQSGVEAELSDSLLRLPNLPDDDCPEGSGEEDNVVVRHHGYDPADYSGKTYLPHWETGSRLGIYDGERSAKISGSMFSLLRGDGARLLWALAQYGIDLNREKYEPIAPPHFVRTETFTATGHLPKFEEDAYKLRDDDLWAIPTGEVPLMSLHRDEILPVEELPKRFLAYTVCFRREAGSAGKDTRGFQRVHEFQKVELLILCTPEQAHEEFEGMLADAERAIQLLELPYRILDLCAGDLTFSSHRIFDIEVYSPGVDRWLEVSSVGKFTDFQARRARIRYRREQEKPRLVHALNGSGIATPRVWAAIVEHYCQPDGTIRVPEVLVPYLKCETIGARD